jgi:hypothetical protein
MTDPAQLVAELGAVQAQDYPAAKWALGLRLRGVTDQALEDACARGQILRTHVLRPTWHFVGPADIRWLQALTAPRVKAAVASYTRRLGLEEADFARCEAVLARALEGGNSLTRTEVGEALQQAGVAVRDGPTLGHIIFRAELDALVCSGPHRASHPTYVLLEERVPPTRSLDRDAALAELTWRYFSSHGPALLNDSGWWSGLSAAEVRRGLELNSWRLDHESIDGRTYWFRPASPPPMPAAVHLLPNYDEYTVAYRERGLFYDPANNSTGDPRRDVPFGNVIVNQGRVVGRWKPLRWTDELTIDSRWSIESSSVLSSALNAAVQRYGAFRGNPSVGEAIHPD